MIKLMDILLEGVNDPGIFKAVFLAGGPGSGKTFVVKQLFGIPDRLNISASGMKMVNSDKELKFLPEAFLRVHHNNMTKVKEGHFREDGKLVKPADHKQPDLSDLIEKGVNYGS